MNKIAFLGLGAMGSRMAKRLVAAGHTVTVYNRSFEKTHELTKLGARAAETPVAAAKGAEFIISMVTDDSASRSLWQDVKSVLTPAHTVIESSTISPGWSKQLAIQIKATGAHFVEAPVSGSLPQVEAGKLICFIGGEPSDSTPVSEILKSFSDDIRYIGDVGQAAVVKLLVNGYFLAQLATLAELLTLGEKSGLDRNAMNVLFQSLPATSPALKGFLQLAANHDHAVRFSASLVHKDLTYLSAYAEAVGVNAELSALVQKRFGEVVTAGHGNENVSVILE